MERLKLEIAIRKGAVREYPFTTEVRSDLAHLLNVNISQATWYKINIATARYVLHVSQFYRGLSSVTVRTVCKDLIKAIEKFQQTYDRNASNPRIAAFLREIDVDMSISGLTGFYRGILMREIEKCTDRGSIAFGPGWDEADFVI